MQTILACLDGSPNQQRVLATASEQAVHYDARLLLMRAVAFPVGLPSDALTVTPDELLRELLDLARAELEKLAATVACALAPVLVQVGSPWRTICLAATENRVRLIVIGSHGYGGLDHLLGTTAAKVVDHALCSVLVIRPPWTNG